MSQLFNSRYSYHHKLLPLLLTFTTDELTDIRLKSLSLWDKVCSHFCERCDKFIEISIQVGAKYEEEKEDDLKDKLDFAHSLQVPKSLGI